MKNYETVDPETPASEWLGFTGEKKHKEEDRRNVCFICGEKLSLPNQICNDCKKEFPIKKASNDKVD